MPKELELEIDDWNDEIENDNDLYLAIEDELSNKYETPNNFKFEIISKPEVVIPDGFMKFEGYPTEVGNVGRELITRDGEHIWVTDYTEDDGGFWASRYKSDIQTGRGHYWPRDRIKFVAIEESLKESTQKEELDEGAYPLSKKVGESVKNWWEDVIVWNQEHDYIFNIANDDDYEDIEGWHAAMFDMLDDIKKQLEKEDDEELKALFKKGKRIYNNNALSQYREEVEQKEETPINEVLDDEDDIDDDFLSGEDDLVDAEDVDDDFGVANMSYEEKMDFLADDEEEAIDGYDEVIDTIEDEHVKDQLEHIRDEEIAHKEFLDAAKEDSSVSYEDFEHEEDEEEDDDFGVYESLSDNELVQSLVANGSCGDEKEAKERVARMSKEDKDNLSKSIKAQAMKSLLDD